MVGLEDLAQLALAILARPFLATIIVKISSALTYMVEAVGNVSSTAESKAVQLNKMHPL